MCHTRCHTTERKLARGDGYSIIKRKRNGRELAHYEVRIPVPPAWRSKVGKKEVLRSLGTGDRRSANLAAPAIVARLHEEWSGLTAVSLPTRPGGYSPTEAELEEVAVVLGYEFSREAAEAGRKTLRGKGRNLYRAHVNWTRDELEEQVRAAATGDTEPVRGLADHAVEVLGYDLPRDSEGFAKLCDLLNAARLDALREQHRRNTGDLEAEADSKLLRRVRGKQIARAEQGATLLEMFEDWAAEMLAKGEKRADTITQDRKVIAQFASFVGRDRAIGSITAIEVAEYRDTLRELPPKWMSKRELRDLGMRAAAGKARELDLPRTAFTTINKHLSTISPLYRWVGAKPKWAGLRNPCDGLFHAKVRGRNPRPPFTTATLNRILRSPLFVGFRSDGEEHLAGNVRADDWRFWIPLVCLFSGARIGEIAQLRLRDIAEERGAWLIRIRHDEGEGLSTKNGEARVAVIHPILQQIGFLDFHSRCIEAAGGDPAKSLFPTLAPNNRGQISGRASRWWRDYLVAIGVKHGADGQGAHSFRHTLADRLRSEAELLDNQIAVCLGHSVSTTTSGYGSLSQGTVNMLRGYMEAVRFDGVDFTHLIARAS